MIHCVWKIHLGVLLGFFRYLMKRKFRSKWGDMLFQNAKDISFRIYGLNGNIYLFIYLFIYFFIFLFFFNSLFTVDFSIVITTNLHRLTENFILKEKFKNILKVATRGAFRIQSKPEMEILSKTVNRYKR